MMDEFEEEFKKLKLHPKVYFLYEHFFKFFDIRKFVPDDFKKRMFFYWNKYFKRRDDLKTLTDDKYLLLDNFNIDNIITAIDGITEDLKQFNNDFENILSSIDKSIDTTVNYADNFKNMLEDVSF